MSLVKVVIVVVGASQG